MHQLVGAVMSEKGVRCFFRGKSNLKTVLESLRGVLLGIQCCQKIFSMATMKFKGAITKSTITEKLYRINGFHHIGFVPVHTGSWLTWIFHILVNDSTT